MGRLWIEACLNTLQTIPTLFPFTCEAGQAHYNAPPRGVNAHHASAMLTPENGKQAADNVGSPENCEQVAAVPRRNVNRFHGVVKEQHRNCMTLLYGNVSALLLICEIAHDAKRPQPAVHGRAYLRDPAGQGSKSLPFPHGNKSFSGTKDLV